jgi:pyruvate,water dikinase
MVITETFAPPAPGLWELDRSHYPGGTTAISQWLMESCPAAMRKAFVALGVPAETLDVRFVNGFMYSRLRPLIRPDKPSTKLPPLFVLKLASRLHPLMRKRAGLAATALRERPWRAVVADWSATIRPRLEARNAELQAVDLDALDDSALADHLAEVLAWCRETFELHFYLHAFDLGPIGMLLYDCGRWGISATDVVPTLGGASPSTAAPAATLAALRAEVTATGTRPASLDEVRSCSAEAARLLDEYLRRRGQMMITRYDLDGQTLGERPDTVLASILDGGTAPGDHSVAEVTIAALRQRVPVAEQALYDERITEARAAMDLRDDNGPYTAEWPVGLLRLGLLALGRRLVARGRTERAEDTFELLPSEVAPLARTGEGPGADELAARAAERRRLATLTPPARLGPVEPSPPLAALAPPHQVLVGAIQAVLEHLGMAATAEHGAARDPLHGVGIGERSYRGRARLANDPEAALDAMEPGDVLVVRFTTPAYNTVLTLAGAIVTADGGPLCHAAVMARELGIPAVIGASGALDTLTDGAHIEVDPVAGVVRVL